MKKFFLIMLVLTTKLCCEEKVDWEGMMPVPPEELFQDQIEMYQTTKFITNISELSNKLDDLAENVRELRQIIMDNARELKQVVTDNARELKQAVTDNALSSKERFDFEIRITALECENNKLHGEVGFHEKLGQERIAAMNYMISELENKNILLDQKDIMVNQEREENRQKDKIINQKDEIINQTRAELNQKDQVINQKDQVINQTKVELNQKDEEIKKLKDTSFALSYRAKNLNYKFNKKCNSFFEIKCHPYVSLESVSNAALLAIFG